MAKCEKVHLEKVSGGRQIILPHEYIAGICITQMTPQTLSFLEYTYPYYRNSNYELSKKLNFSTNE